MVGKKGERTAPELKRLREARGWSQVELARRVGLKQAMISKFESGENEPKGLRTALALAAELGVDVLEIWPALRPVVGKGSPQRRPQHRAPEGAGTSRKAPEPVRASRRKRAGKPE